MGVRNFSLTSVSSSTGEEEINLQTPLEETSIAPTEDDTSSFSFIDEESDNIISPQEANALEDMVEDFAEQYAFNTN